MTQVELLKPHTHVGAKLAPGAVIELDDDLARWLTDIGTARPAVSAPAAKTATKSEEKSQ
jgi:hypothetical protein